MFVNKCVEVENKIYKFIKKHIIPIGFIIITIFALYLRYTMIDFEAGDYHWFLEKWMNDIINNGKIHALKLSIGDYNCPYLTLLALVTYITTNPLYGIKLISIVFDFVMAISSVILINKLTEKKNNIISLITYFAVLFLPTVFLNGACWAQCDSIYTSFIIISLILLLDEKYIHSFILLGVAFAFKLQFVFVLPVYILIWIKKRKFPAFYFGIIPIVNFIMCLPALIMGRPLKDVIMIYFRQTGTYSMYSSMNFPSIYNLFCPFSEQTANALTRGDIDLGKLGMIITIAIYAIMAFYFISKEVKLSKHNIIKLTIWSIVIATFFMPSMHDRYIYVADVLSIILLINLKNKESLFYALIININSLSGYIRFLFNVEFLNIRVATVLQLLLVIGITYHLHKDLNDIEYKRNLIK